MGNTRTCNSNGHTRLHVVRATCVAVLIAGACLGCHRPGVDPLAVYPVDGEVFVDGKPAEGAVIAFHPTERPEWKSATSRAVVDRDGAFSLTTYAANDGAPEGEYVITVYWPERLLDPNGEGDSLPADKLQFRFASSGKSNLRASLGREPVTLDRVDLKDEAVQGGQLFYFKEQGL